jgi:hypothetical protein
MNSNDAKALHLKIREIAKTNAARMAWAQGLPESLIDEETRAYLLSAVGDPRDEIENCNPFAIKERITEVTSLFELVSKLRIDAISKETALYTEILSEHQILKLEEGSKKIATIAFEADWKASGKTTLAPTEYVTDMFTDMATSRALKISLRSAPGHPLNLLEQILEIRDRYKSELRLLLSRAESVKLAMSYCFPNSPKSLLSEILKLTADNPNPLPSIAKWLRNLSLLLEKGMLESKLVTIYRFIHADGWTNQDLPALLKTDGDITVDFELNRKNLGLKDDEYARMISIGVSPSFLEQRINTYDDATKNLPWISNLRSSRKQLSFDMNLSFEQAVLKDADDGDKEYSFKSFKEVFGGIPGWGIDCGSLDQFLHLREISQWTNRTIGETISITLANTVRDNVAATTRNKVIFPAYNEMMLHDFVVGLQFYVYKKA